MIVMKNEGRQDDIDSPIFFLFLSSINEKISINPIKKKILSYLWYKKEGISISQISHILKIDYKNTWRYIKDFQKQKIVILDPATPSQGKKVLVSINHNYLSEEKGLSTKKWLEDFSKNFTKNSMKTNKTLS